MASAAVEQNQQSVSTFGSKSTRTLNDASAEKKNNAAAKCSHFSIRGYVSEVRKRDPKLCDPFGIYAEGSEMPPMEVPMFRWWQCAGCVPEAVAQEVQKDSADVAGPVIVEVQLGRNTEASTSNTPVAYRNLSPATLSADAKGKGKALVEHELATTSVHYRHRQCSPIQGIPRHATDRAEVLRSDTDEAIPRSRVHENGIIESHRPFEGSADRDGEKPDEIRREKAQASSDTQLAGMQSHGTRAEVAGILEGPDSDGKGRVVSLPDLNQCNSEPSDDEENDALVTASTNNLCDDDEEDYLGTGRRKTPKVRLLSELLGLKENQNDSKAKKKNPSAPSSSAPSSSRSTFSEPNALSSMNENGKRKRGGPSEEESKSVEMRSFLVNGVIKKPRTSHYLEVSESDSEDKPTEEVSEAVGRRRSKSNMDRNHLLEKRHKRIKIDNGASSSVSRQRIISRLTSEKEKSSEKHTSTDANSEKAIDKPQKSDSSAQMDERISVSAKKKGKMLQTGKEQTSLIPDKNNVPRECESSRKDEEGGKKVTENVGKEAIQDGFLRKGLHLFPNSHLFGANDKIQFPTVKDGFHLLSSAAEASPAFSHTTTMRSQLDGNEGERNVSSKSNAKGKKVLVHEAGNGVAHPQRTTMQMPNVTTNVKDLTNEIRGRIQDIDINSIPADDRAPEQGPGDDIPMDIVELMAKNQYERNLVDPKDQQSSISLSSNDKGATASGNAGADGPKFGSPPLVGVKKPLPWAADARNCSANGSEGKYADEWKNFYGPLFESSRGYPNQRGLAREDQVRQRPVSLSTGQGKDLSFPYYNWSGPSVPMQRLPPSFLQAMESYNRFRASTTPRPSFDHARVWPSVVAAQSPSARPSRMPVGITNPEMLRKGKAPQQNSRVISFSPVSLGKQNNGNVSNSGTKSMDLYSNEAIPAMHLLSLMQNAAKSQSPSGLPDHQQLQYKQQGSQKAGPSGSRRSSPSQSNFHRHPCYTAVPLVRPNDGIHRSNTGFISPIPLTSRGQRNIEGSHLVPPGPQGRQFGGVSTLDKGKGVFGIPASPGHPRASGTRAGERPACPVPQKMVCVVNRNPSEFNDLRELSKYTIGPDDLRPRGTARAREKLTPRRRGENKRQEMKMKGPVGINRSEGNQRKP